MEAFESPDYYESEEWRERFNAYLLAVRKRVFTYVRQHPGCTATQINREVGTLAGMKE
jgi:hypothetical protein